MYEWVNHGEQRDSGRNDSYVHLTCRAGEHRKPGDGEFLAEPERKQIPDRGGIHGTHAGGMTTHHLGSWGMSFMENKTSG